MNRLEFFRQSYSALTGHPDSFPWQERLFLKLCQCDIPTSVDIPTGCGKTSVMPVWLLALAYQAGETRATLSLPRRLIWVVNRRVVVDQASGEAESLRDRLEENGPSELSRVREALRSLSATGNGDLMGVSTLRGQLADNSEWRADPARPAVIVGTVDMIGSRLLFSGYGCGFKARPLQAGFIAQDSLLVHDEAHLEPAFQKLIEAIESEQERRAEGRRLRVMALTATSRANRADRFSLTEADHANSEIARRIEAKKGLAFHLVEDKGLNDQICKGALDLRQTGQAVLIFLRKLESVRHVVEKLRRERLEAEQLTGTLRGYERDEKMRSSGIFARFLPDSPASRKGGTVYLVCTSAGEVGVNMSADHLICDLTPFDSMAQRLGRVNRFGTGDAMVEVVHSEETGSGKPKKRSKQQQQFERARDRTFELLQRLPRRLDERCDGSPLALNGLPAEDRLAAFTPPPTILPATEVLFDAWALTSIRGPLPGRPPVADWLHGIADWEPSQTYVAWREEVDVITPELAAVYSPEDLLEDYPLKQHELLRDATSRVAEELEKIAERLKESVTWIVDSDGRVEVAKLAEFDREQLEQRLADRTVLVGPACGGLKDGMLDGGSDASAGPLDVADQWADEASVLRRRRVWDSDEPPAGMRLVRTIDTKYGSDGELTEEDASASRRYWRWYVRPRSADDDGSQSARGEQGLDAHSQACRYWANKLASRLGLAEPEASAVAFAARWHDLGKGRELWQRSIGNRDFPAVVLAKSGRNNLIARLNGYRHEFGSLVEASGYPEFLRLDPGGQDLVLHLIGAHHGRARPHFPSDEAFDPAATDSISGEMAREVPRRFGRLQRKYGRWRLAYLESLVRAADILASQNIEASPPEIEAARTPGDTA